MYIIVIIYTLKHARKYYFGVNTKKRVFPHLRCTFDAAFYSAIAAKPKSEEPPPHSNQAMWHLLLIHHARAKWFARQPAATMCLSLSWTSRLCQFQNDATVSVVSFLWFLVRSVQSRISLDLSHNVWVTKWNLTANNIYLLINFKNPAKYEAII